MVGDSSKGGQAVVKKYGREYMAELGRRGREKQLANKRASDEAMQAAVINLRLRADRAELDLVRAGRACEEAKAQLEIMQRKLDEQARTIMQLKSTPRVDTATPIAPTNSASALEWQMLAEKYRREVENLKRRLEAATRGRKGQLPTNGLAPLPTHAEPTIVPDNDPNFGAV